MTLECYPGYRWWMADAELWHFLGNHICLKSLLIRLIRTIAEILKPSGCDSKAGSGLQSLFLYIVQHRESYSGVHMAPKSSWMVGQALVSFSPPAPLFFQKWQDCSYLVATISPALPLKGTQAGLLGLGCHASSVCVFAPFMRKKPPGCKTGSLKTS